ncbi:MAG: response regulator [Tannerella sp.]|jgi:two-component system LytT family response regulator|nr:response regulator [Tannerella sp.]
MNKIIKTVIVDDECASIRKLIKDLESFPDIRVIGTATSSEEARQIIIDAQPDLLFLDIEMPGLSGIDLLREIRQEIRPDMRIIFFTAHDKYFREAMFVSDFDYYLLKPYLPEELSEAVKRIRAKGSKATVEQLLEKVIRENRFALQTVSSLDILKHNDILLFEYAKGTRNWQVVFTDRNKPRNLLRTTVTAKEIMTISPNFVQISQNCIVNLMHLASIENKTLKCCFSHRPETEQNVSLRFYRKIKDMLDVL